MTYHNLFLVCILVSIVSFGLLVTAYKPERKWIAAVGTVGLVAAQAGKVLCIIAFIKGVP